MLADSLAGEGTTGLDGIGATLEDADHVRCKARLSYPAAGGYLHTGGENPDLSPASLFLRT